MLVIVLVKVSVAFNCHFVLFSNSERLVHLSLDVFLSQMPFHVGGIYRDAFLDLLDCVLVLRLRQLVESAHVCKLYNRKIIL